MEMIFLRKSKVDIYKTGSMLQPPLFLEFINQIDKSVGQFLIWEVIFVLIDLTVAFCIFAISLDGSEKDSVDKGNEDKIDVDLRNGTFCSREVLIGYLYNPAVIMSCLGKNLGIIGVGIVMSSLLAGRKGLRNLAIGLITLATYIDPYNFLFLAPILSFSGSKWKVSLLKFIVAFSGLLGFSSVISSPHTQVSFEFLSSVYGSRLMIEDLRPNSGLTWYLFAQIFSDYRVIFTIIVQMLIFVHFLPCWLKFGNDPMILTFVLAGIANVFKPYPTTTDFALFITLSLLNSRVLNQCKITPVLFLVFPGLFVFMSNIWLYITEHNGFNLNFYYILTLVWNILVIIMIIDFIRGYFRMTLERDNPKVKDYVLFQR